MLFAKFSSLRPDQLNISETGISHTLLPYKVDMILSKFSVTISETIAKFLLDQFVCRPFSL